MCTRQWFNISVANRTEKYVNYCKNFSSFTDDPSSKMRFVRTSLPSLSIGCHFLFKNVRFSFEATEVCQIFIAMCSRIEKST